MRFLVKSLEALGIACVMIGLVEGIMSETMWMELYLSITGVLVFLVGRGIEKTVERKQAARDQLKSRPDTSLR
jgi:hypothetical protein